MPKKNVLNDRGSVLLPALIVMAVVGAISYGFVAQFQTGLGDQRYIREQQTAGDIQLQTLALLRDPAICAANFRNMLVTNSAADTLDEIISEALPRKTVFAEGDQIVQGLLILENLRLSEFQPNGTLAPDSRRGTLTLNIIFGSGDGRGPKRARKILLAAELNDYPPAAAGPVDGIKNCVAIGTDDDIWRLSGSGDIYYSTNHVGVSQPAPGPIGAGQGPLERNLHVNGAVLAQDFYHPSDASLKKAVVPSQGLQAIERLRGVKFTWADDSKGAYGVIAQEIERIFPEMVIEDRFDGMKRVDYDQLVAPLIESVKELSERNQELKRRIQHLNELR